MPKKDTDAQNMPGHAARIKKGRLRKLRGDTQIKTIEKRYGVDFGVRDDMRWDTYKEREDVSSINEAIKNKNKK